MKLKFENRNLDKVELNFLEKEFKLSFNKIRITYQNLRNKSISAQIIKSQQRIDGAVLEFNKLY